MLTKNACHKILCHQNMGTDSWTYYSGFLYQCDLVYFSLDSIIRLRLSICGKPCESRFYFPEIHKLILDWSCKLKKNWLNSGYTWIPDVVTSEKEDVFSHPVCPKCFDCWEGEWLPVMMVQVGCAWVVGNLPCRNMKTIKHHFGISK